MIRDRDRDRDLRVEPLAHSACKRAPKLRWPAPTSPQQTAQTASDDDQVATLFSKNNFEHCGQVLTVTGTVIAYDGH